MEYIEQCLKDHIQGMKSRLKRIRRKRDLLSAQCELFEEEIFIPLTGYKWVGKINSFAFVYQDKGQEVK